ncbi:hypothetical protein BO94DRAFT_325127 [Aspergillus sclerotioniger CBS 115572]|uniref:Uncharacterized protein n=1 Tax=Aspergillus sclerotioniger CBS 115572 TaxID=1450535 RepID=A0A317X9B2_9EURO|nr:hypothetical protein BO94DRAFT_325127 [Aspergillus sclerotioniger CBS 115572]PWY94222.1 hypothetical protein BO94DRAFT_325127 [Aspergillus sclerotioniger CBS 115572]
MWDRHPLACASGRSAWLVSISHSLRTGMRVSVQGGKRWMPAAFPISNIQGGTVSCKDPHTKEEVDRLGDCEVTKSQAVLQPPGRRRVFHGFTFRVRRALYIVYLSLYRTRRLRPRADESPQEKKNTSRGRTVQQDAKSMLRGLAFGRLQVCEIHRGSSAADDPQPARSNRKLSRSQRSRCNIGAGHVLPR